jgi:hypothetical protein
VTQPELTAKMKRRPESRQFQNLDAARSAEPLQQVIVKKSVHCHKSFMKALFLDIDGVLNCEATPNPRKLPYIVDEQLLARFRRLVDATQATVVLSSTWRVDPVGRLAARFYEVPFDDVCPDMPGAPRCEELVSWLRAHPEVTRYAVIDDSDDCLDELPLFQPSAKTGLTPEMADGIENYLAGRSDKDMRLSAIERFGQRMHALLGRDKS